MILQLPFWDFFKSLDRYPEYFETKNYWIYVIMAASALAIVVMIFIFIGVWIHSSADKRRSTRKRLTGELLDKRYVGEQSSSGSGTVVMPSTSGGVGIGMVSTSSHSEEEFLFFVKADKIYKMTVDMQQFFSKNIGDKLDFEVTIGGLTEKELEVIFIA